MTRKARTAEETAASIFEDGGVRSIGDGWYAVVSDDGTRTYEARPDDDGNVCGRAIGDGTGCKAGQYDGTRCAHRIAARMQRDANARKRAYKG